MIYEDYLHDMDEVVLARMKEKKYFCRRCGKEFKPEDKSGTNARSYRCEECLSTKALLIDMVNSCVIS